MQPLSQPLNATNHHHHTANLPLIQLVPPPDMPRHPPDTSTDLAPGKLSAAPAFEDDMDRNPHEHFLSPGHDHPHRHGDWPESDDDDDSDDELEWDNGITDFSLYNEEKKRAEQTGGQIDSRWDSLVAKQESAMNRSLQRARTGPLPIPHLARPLDSVPDLTPDNSPRLQDTIGPRSSAIEPEHQQSAPDRPRSDSVAIRFDSDDDSDYVDSASSDDDFDDEPLSFHIRQRQQQRRSLTKADRKLQRPGLRSFRTLSGKAHSWTRPSWYIYVVGEEPEEPAHQTAADTASVPKMRRTVSENDATARKLSR